MTGAGISVSAGIPDFRSPGTGLYDNVKEYDLPTPEALFTLDFFLNNPKPFYKWCQTSDLKNGNLTTYNATPTHYFIKMLHDKGLLLNALTQNIDNLEEKTGIDMNKVIQCHGANKGAHCAKCKKVQDMVKLHEAFKSQVIMYCD